MSDLIIFAFGLVVTGMTVAATILVGLSEAGDTGLTRDKDLTGIERKWVGERRQDQGSD